MCLHWGHFSYNKRELSNEGSPSYRKRIRNNKSKIILKRDNLLYAKWMPNVFLSLTQNFKKLLSIVLYLKVWIAILQSTLLTVVLPPAFPATGSFSSVYLHKCVENTFVDLLHYQMSSFPMSTNAGHSFWNDDFQALFLGKLFRGVDMRCGLSSSMSEFL